MPTIGGKGTKKLTTPKDSKFYGCWFVMVFDEEVYNVEALTRLKVSGVICR